MSDTDAGAATDKTMRLRYAGPCRLCGAQLTAGEVAVYERPTKTVRCVSCPQSEVTSPGPSKVADVPTPSGPPVIESGVAGASAQREHARRAAKREDRIRAAHPKLGGLMLALSGDPQTTRVWSTGAVGEQIVARSLDKWANEHVRMLHDRRIPRTKANIDHIAVAPSGVYVIDAKRYKGWPDLRIQGGILRPRTTTLVVGGRDCTKLLDGMHKQVDLVRSALDQSHPDVPVRGMLCFVDADWPLIGGAFSIDHVDVLWPKKAAQLLNNDGPLSSDQVFALHQHLAATFPVA
ncbi:nuclease-related domain-containing protein [Cellulomonas sp. Root137]|uniref:nuclease-related domain-containing protein n=1 Tax=Cellulomonas sp. Root137 TaxID=1736459 RepID=UPI001F3597FE|nr:nuclease-related domain-containing protein [Cellulomonas sp. Root137]